ncbi:Tpr-related protein family member, putative [Theileria annulata]|uniref:Tpr-related protein family member, putative n=1 Tax=Theileria annulata TaxID=5874 RepID=Q4UF37_THEAN|nr:Tpr-related protein family member, putative [Theileria annulata]CAI74302.1 Tpr-related protein family member, putative [Theileria annulata]|eukprot:XP_952034.1 Tpr-related protein family member, putative [Theileria annulata]
MSAPGGAETKQEHPSYCPIGCMPAEDDRGNCSLLMSAYILAGLAMMLNIRLSYSSAPYALIRFKLPENLFSVFVRRMASSLELWCLPGFIIADSIELAVKLIIKFDTSYGDNSLKSKELKFYAIIVPSVVAQWLNFLTYVLLLVVYVMGDDQGHLTTFYFVIAASGFVFGINNVFVFAADYNYIPIYIAGENCFPALTSFIHYITTLIFGNRRKYDSDFIIVYIDIFVAIIISFVAAIVWTIAYGLCPDASFDGKITYTTTNDITKIIVTGIPTTDTNEETITITGGKVNIKTGTVKDGNCTYAPKTTTLTDSKATITPPKDGKATLTIDINVKTTAPEAVLNALAHLASPLNCKVTVDTAKNTLTITIAPATAEDKCIEIEITADDLGADALKGTTKATVRVDPAPNHLTIKYGSEKEISFAVKITEAEETQGMTAITKDIADGIKKTAEAAPPGSKNYYYVTHTKTNIRYSITLKNQLEAATANTINNAPATIIVDYGHIFAEGFSDTSAKPSMVSPLLIVLVGMGLVYAIYPGIAPGMIVPFYLVDKIEMILLIATIFPPVIIALLQKFYPNWSPKTKYVWHGPQAKNNGFGGWTQYPDKKESTHEFYIGEDECEDSGQHFDVHAYLWHLFDLLIVTMIILAYLFIYSLHYTDSNISRSIVNQPKMSTALTIIFYMCHEISLAVGFPGMVANAAEYTVIAQMVGAFLMVFLALYSEGYIIEYKSHDPAHWPTTGMTPWNAFCY